ncbi:MAG: hypothetical protein ACJ757_07650 [Gaiellaceae bacterium]
MALGAVLPAIARPFALARGLTVRVALTLVVAASFVVRVVASGAHPAPLYFPDEYLYTAISRSLGSGHGPSVRGTAAHFPALLEPLLAAPFQALFSPELAYRLTQAENALLMSTAAIPVYLLARRLQLSARYSLACAVFAVAIPDLVYSAFTVADPVAYPLALGAVAAGVAAIERPSRRSQLLFLTLALLATSARVQYIVLPVAFVVAALVVDGRRVVKTQRLSLALIALPALGALALGPAHMLGYYSHVVDLHVGRELATWVATDLFLLAFAAGIVLVPGALVALLRPRGRAETAFAALAVAFAGGLVFEAALYASNGPGRFKERYLFALLPLVPLAFGLYLKHGRPGRLAIGVISLGLFGASARVPLSEYATTGGSSDSPFLLAVFQVQRHLGVASTSLLLALLAASGAAGAVLVSRRGGGRYALGATLAVAAFTSVAVTVELAAAAHNERRELPSNISWVDESGLKNVTLLQTVGSPPMRSFQQLYWNRSLVHEALLGAALPTDVYAAARVRIAKDGTLVGVGPNVLLQEYAATVRFANARPVARAGTFSLWAADTAPQLMLLEQGRYFDGWLARSGTLTVWPDAAGNTRGSLRFGLSLPADATLTTMRFGKAEYTVRPGERTTVIYTIDARGPWSLPFSTIKGGGAQPGLRFTSVLSTPPVLTRAGEPSAPLTSTA